MNDSRHDLPDDKDHPAAKGVGAAVGAAAGGVAGGAAAGALAGGITGPIGAVVGAAVGALAGVMTRETRPADPVLEDTIWRDNYSSRPYVASGARYDDYQPAYRYGAESHARYPDRSFDEVEPELERDWGRARGQSPLEWEHARHASRDAWHRAGNAVERVIPGDSDGDGR
jgi:hypothetical protein